MRMVAFLFLMCIAHALGGQVVSYKQMIKAFRSAEWQSLIHDPRTKLPASDSIFLRYYDTKESNKVYCAFTAIQDQTILEIPTYNGQMKTYKKYGKISFTWDKKPVNLIAYQSVRTSPGGNKFSNYLFIPFKDKTTGDQTYAGGRYVEVFPEQIKDGHLILDLNKVYNPWCAYSDGYSCPIPPSENTLNVAITAGEKKFAKAH